MTQLELLLSIFAGVSIALLTWWSFWWLLWKITGYPKGLYTDKEEN